MIVFKRLGGELIALNPDLIERVEATPDTVVTMVDATKFLVAETLEEVLTLITDYRAYVISRSNNLTLSQTGGRPTLHVVPNELIASSDVTETYGTDPEGLDLEFDGVDVGPVDLAFEAAQAAENQAEGLVHLEFRSRNGRSVLEGDELREGERSVLDPDLERLADRLTEQAIGADSAEADGNSYDLEGGA